MPPKKQKVWNVFITGSTGCVGQYFLDLLVNNPKYKLFILVRNRDKLPERFAKAKNIKILDGDLERVEKFDDALGLADYLVHIATTWGGHDPTNVDAVHKMLDRVNRRRFKKGLLFSTASILGRGNQLLDAAEMHGTGYIKSKYRIFQELQDHDLSDRLIHIFPTAVIGGDKDHPLSHVSKGLTRLKFWMRWMRFIYIDFGFHFIHAKDIAQITQHILENDLPGHEFVLGNKYLSVKDFIAQVAQFYDLRPPWFRLRISYKFVRFLIFILRIKVSQWDQFSMDYKYFRYQTVNCRTFGLPSQYFSVAQIMQEIEVQRT